MTFAFDFFIIYKMQKTKLFLAAFILSSGIFGSAAQVTENISENFEETQNQNLNLDEIKNQNSNENQESEYKITNQDSGENQNLTESKNRNPENEKPEINQNLKVAKINFHGLKKTKNFYIQSKVKKFLGVKATDFDQHGLETALQLEGLFDDIQISMKEISETEASVEVSLKEKITFIPLPFAMYSSSGFAGGLMVMDTNAFGMKNMFMFGGLYSKSSVMGMAMFSRPPQQNGIPGFSAFLSTSKDENTISNLDDDEVLKYDAVNLSSRISVSEQIGEFNTVSIDGFFKSVSASEVKDFQEVDSMNSAGAGFSWQASKSDWNGWFMSSCGAGFSAEITLYSSKSDYRLGKTISANLRVQKPISIAERLRFYSAASAFYGKDQHISSYSGGGAGAVSILPGKFRTSEIAGGNAGFEFALFKGKIGTLSIYGDYQAVSARDFDDEFCFMHGPNGGIRVYLAKIAFPALAMGVSYNVTKNSAQFAAAMGISM